MKNGESCKTMSADGNHIRALATALSLAWPVRPIISSVRFLHPQKEQQRNYGIYKVQTCVSDLRIMIELLVQV